MNPRSGGALAAKVCDTLWVKHLLKWAKSRGTGEGASRGRDQKSAIIRGWYDFDGVHIFATRSRVGLQCIFLQVGPFFGGAECNFLQTRAACLQKFLTRESRVPARKQSKLFYLTTENSQSDRSQAEWLFK